MRIACLFPSNIGLERPEDRAFLEQGLRGVSPPGVQADLVFAAEGRPYTCSLDVDLFADPAARSAVRCEREGYDGILLDVTWDFGIEAARRAVKFPVVGAASATFHTACQMADNYAVVGVSEGFEGAIKKNMVMAGVMDKMLSYRNIDAGLVLPFDKATWNPAKFERDITETALQQVREGAQVIIGACGILFSILPEGARERMEAKLGVPFLDMQAIGLHTTVTWVKLGITHSKKAYPQIDVAALLARA